MFGIVYENPLASAEGQPKSLHAWQTSWGLSTRSLGIMVMVHGDDQGLVLPPRVAQIQAVVIPCGISAKTSDEDRQCIFESVARIVSELKSAGIRAQSDIRDNYTPGWKYNYYEMKGVPLRLEGLANP